MVDNRFCASPAFDVIFDQSAYIAFNSPVLILDFHKTVECPSIEPDTQLDAEFAADDAGCGGGELRANCCTGVLVFSPIARSAQKGSAKRILRDMRSTDRS